MSLIAFLGACSGDDDSGDTGDDTGQTADSGDDNDTGADDTGDTADDGQAAIDEAEQRAAAAEASLEAANATITETQASVDSLNTELETANATNTELTATVASETARADDAEAKLTAIGDEFPIEISTAITPAFDVRGNYTFHFEEAYCEGITTCGQQRPDVASSITDGPQGLLLTVPGAFTAGLLGVEGKLVAGSDSNTIATCNGQPRTTRVLTTVFGTEITIAEDGTRTLSGLGASVFIQAAPTDDGCPAISIFYGATLTPV